MIVIKLIQEIDVIINNAPANEAVLSNVGEIGEFRIRNSAKAFNSALVSRRLRSRLSGENDLRSSCKER